MTRIAVIGAGPMGLRTALDLLKSGHEVDLYEADRVVGGMTAAFDFDGLSIERFYHFICTGDQSYIDTLRELGVEDRLRWVSTAMGYYHKGEIKVWGNPVALLKFSGLSLIAKFRYGLLIYSSMKRRNWQRLESTDAVSWLVRWLGQDTYDQLWRPLFDLKFYQFTDNLSAAWIWARMKRLGMSRKNLMEEKLGYLEGGSQIFLEAICAEITRRGGRIHLNSKVDEIVVENGQVVGVHSNSELKPCEAAISTIPLPFVSQMIPALPAHTRELYDAVDNIAVVCVLVKLARPYDRYFWLNVSDENIKIPGIIEYTNLNPMSDSVVYVPFYLPGDHPDYQREDSWFVERTRSYLQKMKPDFDVKDILSIRAGRYRYAQPICPPNFLATLPPMETGIEHLLVADTSHYYPEDRSISESVRLGSKLASTLLAGLAQTHTS
ncbi:MAG: protoporphyrinogen oxidase [Halieaceae bacterium]|jgi:protoporphyrinogen oxidase